MTTLTRDRERTQGRILDAALAEFAAKGFAGARVDAIARRARINKAMLYHYFGSKEALFRAILNRKIRERLQSLARLPEDLRIALDSLFADAARDRLLIRLLEWEALEVGEGPIVAAEERRESWCVGARRVRQVQRRAGGPDLPDPECLVLALAALTIFPFAFPQLTRLATGRPPSDSGFRRRYAAFLRQLGALLDLPLEQKRGA